ncbi:MAG: class I SAM-dependent methyltransferase, partial [Anaerolineaceae bacterium]
WPDEKQTETALVLNHTGSLRAMFSPGTEVGMAEAYLYNDVDIEGNLELIFDLADRLTYEVGSLGKRFQLLKLLKELPTPPSRVYGMRGPANLKGKRHSVERDQQAVTYHYDVSNDFYSLWLDPNMVYSCGYFQNADDAIDKAQVEKLSYICKKLRLKSGQRLLDIGCGWGGLVICAAQNYGVDATGITLSQPQADYANKRIAEFGLSEKARVLVQDYREVPESEPYDTLVSVGMFEHVGADLLKPYFEKAYRLLKPHGVFLNHGIATTESNKSPKRDSFSDHYVFPDGELVPIFETLTKAESAGFEVRDVESLREHYILTLRQWVKRLEESHDRAMQYVDEPTYRVWRLYMSGSIHGFKRGRLNVYQSLFAKPDDKGSIGLPLSRKDWYKH